MTTISDVKNVLDNIQSKQEFVSEEAKRAKLNMSGSSNYYEDQAISFQKQEQLLKEFNVSIQLLMRLFKASKFDEVMSLVARPGRLMFMNFMIGLVRGLGFVFSVSILAFFAYVLFNDSMPFFS